MALLGKGEPKMGIPKAPVEKKGLFKFLEVYGRRMWQIFGLNVIFLLACIPIVTIGPAIAGMTKVCRNWSQERNAFIWSDFWGAFKSNFKQSFFMGIIDIICAIGFAISIPYYYAWADESDVMYIPLLICICCCVLFFMMHFYIYLMIVSTNLTMRKIIKNSFFLVPLGVKNCLWTLLIWIICIFLMVGLFPYSLLVVLFFPFSFLCFVNAFNCYPIIRKYVIQPYYDARGEDNPEFDYLKTEKDAVFEDKGGEETVPEKEHKKKKGKAKIIS